MAFRLRIDEPIEKGFRRIGVEQIERARRQLAANADPETEVHEARKCIKRIRALLRLGREGLGETVFRAENAQFRSIAALLASSRDDHVMLQTIVKLEAEDDGRAHAALGRLKTAVRARRAPEAETAAGRAEADEALDRATRRFRRLRVAPNSFATLERGLVRNYRKGIERRALACTDGTDEAFHEWRKCVQAYWRHMALLSRAWPPLFEVHIETAREISQMLGDDHDMALLRHALATLPPDTLPAADAEAIEALIASRQSALRQAAKAQGELLFAERPKAFGRRIAAIWESTAERARDEKPPKKGAAPAETDAIAPQSRQDG